MKGTIMNRLFISGALLIVTLCAYGCGTMRDSQNPQPKTVVPCAEWTKAAPAGAVVQGTAKQTR